MKASFALKITAATLALAAAAFPAAAKTYRFATNVTEDSTAGQLIGEFVEAVAARTDGRVKFKLFHNGVLGEQAQYLQQIQSGVLDAGLVNSGTLETIVPAVGVLNLPYVFRDTAEYTEVMTAPAITQTLAENAAAARVFPLGFLSSGFRSIYTTKPVADFAGLKGLKLRAISSPTYRASSAPCPRRCRSASSIPACRRASSTARRGASLASMSRSSARWRNTRSSPTTPG